MCIIEWVESVYSQSIRTGTFLILALIGIVFVLSLLFSKRKKVHLTLLIFMVVFYIFAKVHCGASLKDVSVMKPMAEAISNYIVKNGIPKSLEDIPDLPYELECGKIQEEYLAMNYIKMVPVKKNKAELYNKRENCHFKNIELSYWLQHNLKDKNGIGISLRMFSSNRTSYYIAINEDDRGRFIASKANIGSSKDSDICNPMRQ